MDDISVISTSLTSSTMITTSTMPADTFTGVQRLSQQRINKRSVARGFFKLPPEIRDCIYDIVIYGDNALTGFGPGEVRGGLDLDGVLSANRKLRHEVQDRLRAVPQNSLAQQCRFINIDVAQFMNDETSLKPTITNIPSAATCIWLRVSFDCSCLANPAFLRHRDAMKRAERSMFRTIRSSTTSASIEVSIKYINTDVKNLRLWDCRLPAQLLGQASDGYFPLY